MTSLLFAIGAATGVGLSFAPPAPPAGPSLLRTPTFLEQQPAKPVTSITSGVMVLHGTNDHTGIDPALAKVTALSKPPFSSYNSWKLLDQASLTLQKGKPTAWKLPTGRDLQVTFKDVLAPPRAGDPPRYVVDAGIEKADGKAFIPHVEVNAKAGEWFFVGGQDYKGGTLFIGLKVSP